MWEQSFFLCALSSPPPHIPANAGPRCRTRKARLQPGECISGRHSFSNMGPVTIRRFQALRPGGETPASSRFSMLNKPQKGDVCISLVETKCGKILPSWITDANCSPSSCFSWKAFGSYLLFPGNFLKPWFSSYAVRAPRMGGGQGQPPCPSRAGLVWSVFLIFLT